MIEGIYASVKWDDKPASVAQNKLWLTKLMDRTTKVLEDQWGRSVVAFAYKRFGACRQEYGSLGDETRIVCAIIIILMVRRRRIWDMTLQVRRIHRWLQR